MKNSLILFAVLLIPALIFGQSKRKKKAETPKVFIGFNYESYSSNLVIDKDASSLFANLDNARWKKGEGVSYNFFLGYGINKKLDITSGVSINNFSIVQSAGFNFWRCDPELFGAKDIAYSERLVELNSIDIPIDLRYKFKFKKLSFSPSIGLTTMIYSPKKQSVEMTLDNGVKASHPFNDVVIEHNRKTNFAFVSKIGLAYSITPKISLNMNFSHSYRLGNDELLSSKTYKSHLSSLGIGIGCEYALLLKKQ